MNLNKKRDLETFYKYCKNEIKYGWMDQNVGRHTGINDGKTYSLQSPEELMTSKLGICWDRTELYRDYFDKNTDLKYETYYLFYEDYKGCPSHSILVYYKNNKVYWFEPEFLNNEYDYSGIHEYNTLNELLVDFKKKWLNLAIINEWIPKNIKKRIYLSISMIDLSFISMALK